MLEKNARDRLIWLAQAHPDWALGFEDEVWWSRVAQPRLRTWAEAHAAAIAGTGTGQNRPGPEGFGVLRGFGPSPRPSDRSRAHAAALRGWSAGECGHDRLSEVELPIVGAPAGQGLGLDLGQRPLAYQPDGAHRICAHNQLTKRTGQGVRILVCYLPSKSPWLNPIEPKWMHGKRAIVEPARLLPADELADRVCARFDCVHAPHLVAPERFDFALSRESLPGRIIDLIGGDAP